MLARKPRLTETMKKERLDFAKRHAVWNTEMWKKALFSDESSANHFSVQRYRVFGSMVDHDTRKSTLHQQ